MVKKLGKKFNKLFYVFMESRNGLNCLKVSIKMFKLETPTADYRNNKKKNREIEREIVKISQNLPYVF